MPAMEDKLGGEYRSSKLRKLANQVAMSCTCSSDSINHNITLVGVRLYNTHGILMF
jgi:hypothetical protein